MPSRTGRWTADPAGRRRPQNVGLAGFRWRRRPRFSPLQSGFTVRTNDRGDAVDKRRQQRRRAARPESRGRPSGGISLMGGCLVTGARSKPWRSTGPYRDIFRAPLSRRHPSPVTRRRRWWGRSGARTTCSASGEGSDATSVASLGVMLVGSSRRRIARQRLWATVIDLNDVVAWIDRALPHLGDARTTWQIAGISKGGYGGLAHSRWKTRTCSGAGARPSPGTLFACGPAEPDVR